MAETIEERIRECAYHIWEASGRPSGRDAEFWQQACEIIAANDGRPKSKVPRRKPQPAQSAQPTRKRSRTASPSVSAPLA